MTLVKKLNANVCSNLYHTSTQDGPPSDILTNDDACFNVVVTRLVLLGNKYDIDLVDLFDQVILTNVDIFGGPYSSKFYFVNSISSGISSTTPHYSAQARVLEGKAKQAVEKHNKVSSTEYIDEDSVDQRIQTLLFLEYVSYSQRS